MSELRSVHLGARRAAEMAEPPGPAGPDRAAGVDRVRVVGVSHSFGRRPALRDVSLTLPVGVTGLLGPNGAGKTTLMRILVTAATIQTGEVWFGEWPLDRQHTRQARQLIGYLPQRFELMDHATLARNLEYAAWAHGLDHTQAPPAIKTILRRVGLEDRAKSRVRSLSGGMRQRLGLACALVHQPRIAILDEPTVGLDPVQRGELRRLIAELGQQSVVLVSTHLVEDLTADARQVAILHEGRLRFAGTTNQLRQLAATTTAHASPLEAGYETAITNQPATR